MFGQFAIYRARRYRLTRTVWRGVRFWMSGSGWAYAGRSLLWGLGTVVTLGLLLPWREAALERYKMRHSYYGDLQGGYEDTGSGIFQARLVAVAARAFLLLSVSGSAFYLRRLQGGGVALVAVRDPVRRGATRNRPCAAAAR